MENARPCERVSITATASALSMATKSRAPALSRIILFGFPGTLMREEMLREARSTTTTSRSRTLDTYAVSLPRIATQ
jgi:hypothetical protein